MKDGMTKSVYFGKNYITPKFPRTMSIDRSKTHSG